MRDRVVAAVIIADQTELPEKPKPRSATRVRSQVNAFTMRSTCTFANGHVVAVALVDAAGVDLFTRTADGHWGGVADRVEA